MEFSTILGFVSEYSASMGTLQILLKISFNGSPNMSIGVHGPINDGPNMSIDVHGPINGSPNMSIDVHGPINDSTQMSMDPLMVARTCP